MSLWIRSQDKTELVKVEGIKYEKVPVGHSLLVPYEFGVFNVGQYESKERALEILNDIQSKLFNSNRVIVQTKYPCHPEDLYKMKMDFEGINEIPAIVHDIGVEVTPMNQEVFIYEMPEK